MNDGMVHNKTITDSNDAIQVIWISVRQRWVFIKVNIKLWRDWWYILGLDVTQKD